MSENADIRPRPTYDASAFDLLATAEDRHFWFRSRRAYLGAVLARLRSEGGPRRRILEMGCGSGGVVPVLQKSFPGALVVGCDLYVSALRTAAARTGATFVAGDVTSPPLRGPFDLVAAMDVIEHLDDDRGALRHLGGLLGEGGLLVVTVPAGRWLWSDVDEEAHHRRRYSSADLRAALVEGGFEVTWQSHFMSLLLPPAALKRLLLDRVRRGRGSITSELGSPAPVNAALEAALRAEAWLARGGRRIPFGTSLIAVARRARSGVR